jgi:hypothetical protein
MVTAKSRFHEELNDFLPRERRKRDFYCVCAREATAKRMIEALGVPYAEAELILVNGESEGFDHRLRLAGFDTLYDTTSRTTTSSASPGANIACLPLLFWRPEDPPGGASLPPRRWSSASPLSSAGS